MIASPSTKNPDYLYSWTRDSALVFKLLIEDFVSGDDPSLCGLIDAYISVEARIQQTSNPSGPAGKGGLGEPKFNIDGSAFTDSWGRPQRGANAAFRKSRVRAEWRYCTADGPVLRATAMMQYAEWLLKTGNSSYVERSLWSIIQLDLDYVVTSWRQPTSVKFRIPASHPRFVN